MKKNIEEIIEDGKICAIIGNVNNIEGKSDFITPNEFGFQLVIQNSNEEYWKRHKHLEFEKIESLPAGEFLYVARGKINVGIYSKDDEKIADKLLYEGSFAILYCGHDIKSLEEGTKFFAIKQGPYREGEKIFF